MIRCGFILEADSVNLFPTPGPRWPLSTPLLTLAPGRWNDDLQQRGEQVSGGCRLHSGLRFSWPGARLPSESSLPAGPALQSDLLGAPAGGALGQCCRPLGESVSLWGSVLTATDPQREVTSSCQEERWYLPPPITSTFISQFVQILDGKKGLSENPT